jgi:hypothetical protein
MEAAAGAASPPPPPPPRERMTTSAQPNQPTHPQQFSLDIELRILTETRVAGECNFGKLVEFTHKRTSGDDVLEYLFVAVYPVCLMPQ